MSPLIARRQLVLGAGLGGLGLLVGCGRLPWQAQQPAKIYRIGYLAPNSAEVSAAMVEGFQRGLRELGYVEGQNIILEGRWADGHLERLPDLAAQLVQLPVDVIVTPAYPATVAARAATSTIPIVFFADADPVGTQMVASLSHPGGNVTGLSNMAASLAGKRLELLKEALPEAGRVAAIWNTADAAMARQYGETLAAAEALGIELQSMGIRTPDDLDRAYQAAVARHLDAVVVIQDPLITRSRDRVVELSTQSGLPTITGDYTFAAAGGLMSYGPNLVRQAQRAAYYVDRILKGSASWKLTRTRRWKSGQRRDPATFVAARRRAGRPERRSAGSSRPRAGATHQSAA
jgi:putative ABC transport system substrate-binding protein